MVPHEDSLSFCFDWPPKYKMGSRFFFSKYIRNTDRLYNVLTCSSATCGSVNTSLIVIIGVDNDLVRVLPLPCLFFILLFNLYKNIMLLILKKNCSVH